MYFPVLYSFLLCIGIFLFIKMKENKESVGFSEAFFSRFITKIKFRNHAKLVIRKKSKFRDFISNLMGDINIVKVADDIEIVTDNISLKILRFNSSIQEKINRILNESGVKNIVLNNGFIKLEVSIFYKNETLEKKGELVEKFEDDLQQIANFIELFLSKAPKNSLTSREKEYKSYLDYVSFKSIQYALLISNLFYFGYTQVFKINSIYMINPFNWNYLYVAILTIVLSVGWFFFIKFLLSDSMWSIKLIREFALIIVIGVIGAVNLSYMTNVVFDLKKKTYSLHEYKINTTLDMFNQEKHVMVINNLNLDNPKLEKRIYEVAITSHDAQKLSINDNRDRLFISIGEGFFNKLYISDLTKLNHTQYFQK